MGKRKLSPFPWLTSSHNAARNNDSRMCLRKQASKGRDQYVMGKIYKGRRSNHENHEKGKNCFRDKGTRKQNTETPKLTFPFRTQSQAFKAAEDRRVKANSLRGDRWTGTWCPAAMQLQCIRVYRSGDQSIDCQQSAVLKEIIRSGEQQ